MRARTGCEACRERHIKCVRRPEGDKCERCFDSNRECYYTSFHRFKDVKTVRHKRRDGQTFRQTLDHDSRQVWVNVPKMIGFIHMDGLDDVGTHHELPDEVVTDGGAASGRITNDRNATEASAGAMMHDVELPDFPNSDSDWEPPQAVALSTGFGHNHAAVSRRVGAHSHDRVPHATSRNKTHETGSSSHQPTSLGLQQHLSPGTDVNALQPLHRSNSHPSAHFSSPRVFDNSPQNSLRHTLLSASPGNLHSPALSLAPSWPFRTSRESKLFYHYIKRISPWIDVLDPSSYFGVEIPRRAAFQPLIANAIYALSSLHQSLLEGREDLESPQYVDEGLQYLKQMLEDPLGHVDENLLAGVILLRSHEEMSDRDENIHLLGGKRLLNSIASYAADGGFRESASWISLRQHIYISLTTQSPLGLNLSNYEHSSVFTSQSDDAWANRAVFLFARVLNYIFGSEDGGHPGRVDTERFAALEAEVDSWNVSKPWYFSVLWTETETERAGPWPVAQTSHPAHAVGLQYYALCKIVLAIYDPRLSRLGFGSLKLRKASEATVLNHLRLAVGIAVSNPDVTNAMFQGSHILAVCGSYLRDPADQEAAVEFLQGMNMSMGWRTGPIIDDLREQWAA